jgi:hypothetical protein
VLSGASAPVPAVVSARFGLAAVAENRGEWDKAREHYQKVVDDGAVPQPFKDQAAARVKALEKISKPVLLGGPATKEAEADPATQGATPPVEAEAPKPDAPETPKPDGPKPDAPAPDAPKPDATKQDAPSAPPAPVEPPAPQPGTPPQ